MKTNNAVKYALHDPLKRRNLNATTLKKVFNFLIALKIKCDSNEQFFVYPLTKEFHVGSGIFLAAKRIGYFTELETQLNSVPRYVCNIDKFDPVHARLVIENLYDMYPKNKNNFNKNKIQNYKCDLSNIIDRNSINDMINNKNKMPPTLKEVEDYCNARKNNVNPQKWYAHYESVDWKVGKNKMIDWKAAVRTWEHPQGTFSQKKLSDYSDQELFDELKKRGYSGLLEINIKKEISF